jgi:ABC-type transporter Mla subunit MlaD
VAAVKGLRPPQEMNTFYAYFKDSQGLNRRADVRFGGTVAGQVMSIELDPERPTELRVTAHVRPEFPINADCVAMVGQTTLTAEKHLEITTGEADAKLLASGTEIQTGGGSLFNQADEIARNVNEVVEHVIDLLGVKDYAEDEEEAAQKDKEELTTVSDIFADLGKTVNEGTGFVKDVRGIVVDSEDDIGDILQKVKDAEDKAIELLDRVNGILEENRGNIKGSVESVRGVLEDVGSVTKSLSDQLDEIASTLQSVLDNADSLSMEVQDMLKDNRAAIEDVILDVRETVRSLKEFSRTIAEQPHSVIIGTPPPGRKSKED